MPAATNPRFSLTYIWRKYTRARSVTIDGFQVASDAERVGARTAKTLWLGTHEMRERALVRKIVKAGDRVLEGGGGLGTVTMNLAHIVGPGNLIVYEPSPLAADILEENLRRNGLSAELRRKGLSDRSGGETLVRTADIVGSSSVAEVEGDTIDIATDSLSDVIEEFAPTVLVLDIEGKEIDALCSSPLDGVRTIIVEIHPRECGDAAYNRMYRHLFEAGFVLRHQRSIGRVLLFQRESTGTPG